MSDAHPDPTSAGNGVVGVAPRRFLPGKRGSLWIVDRHSHQPSGRVAGVVDGEFSRRCSGRLGRASSTAACENAASRRDDGIFETTGRVVFGTLPRST